MRRHRGPVLAIVVGLALSPAISACGRAERQPGDRVISTQPDDRALNDAMKQATATLGVFWREFDRKAAGTSDYGVKLGMTGEDGFKEFIWAYVIRREGDQVVAELANQPEHLRGLKAGSEVRVSEALIADWSYVKDGVSYGNYTTRILLPKMSPEERAQVQLSPAPLEPNAS